MKNIYLLTTIMITALFFSACNDDKEYFPSSTTNITLQACETYTAILAGDTIVQDEANTTIKTVFDTNGSQKACVLTGSAHIVR